MAQFRDRTHGAHLVRDECSVADRAPDGAGNGPFNVHRRMDYSFQNDALQIGSVRVGDHVDDMIRIRLLGFFPGSRSDLTGCVPCYSVRYIIRDQLHDILVRRRSRGINGRIIAQDDERRFRQFPATALCIDL